MVVCFQRIDIFMCMKVVCGRQGSSKNLHKHELCESSLDLKRGSSNMSRCRRSVWRSCQRSELDSEDAGALCVLNVHDECLGVHVCVHRSFAEFASVVHSQETEKSMYLSAPRSQRYSRDCEPSKSQRKSCELRAAKESTSECEWFCE